MLQGLRSAVQNATWQPGALHALLSNRCLTSMQQPSNQEVLAGSSPRFPVCPLHRDPPLFGLSLSKHSQLQAKQGVFGLSWTAHRKSYRGGKYTVGKRKDRAFS